MFRAGEPHRTIPLNYPTTHLSVQFEPEFFSANPSLDMALERVASRGPQIELSMARIFRELRAQDEFSTDSIETLIFGMIEGDGLADREPPVWIRRVAEILNDRWNENVTLRELADVADVHPKTVSKYFRAYFSCTFGEYRRRVRIARAVAMVRGTRLPLTEIAHECGFFDQSHFIRVFREMTGVSPRRFRRF
jgi:AraC family transcriptional regulator